MIERFEKSSFMEIKYWILLFLYVLIEFGSFAQSVTWYDDGSVKVTGDKEAVFYSYIPEKFDDSFNMVHLDVNTLFSDPNLLKGVPIKGYTDAAGVYLTGERKVRFEIFAYDPSKPDKIGGFLYGHDNDSYFRTNEETPFDPLHHNNYYELLGVSSGRSSINPKYWFSRAAIPVPDDTYCIEKGISRAKFRVLLFLHTAESVGGIVEVGTIFNGAKALVKGVLLKRTAKWLLKRYGKKRALLHSVGLGTMIFGSDVVDSFFKSAGGGERCIRYASSIQPIILKLTVKNARVYKHKITGYERTFKPSEVFKKNTNRWLDQDFGNLFNKSKAFTIAAHRGYWRKTGVAQNSIAAIREAMLKSDADMIELDVRSSKDRIPICFHDDKPQQVLRGLRKYPDKTLYDFDWNELKEYHLYDRHGNETAEKLVSLEQAFKYYADQEYTKPINLDIGIPAKVNQGGRKVDGQVFFDAVFLKSIELAAKYGITNRVIFKGKYQFSDPIWNRVKDTLSKYYVERDGFRFRPVIAYTPKLGEEIGAGTHNPTEFRHNYLNNWLAKEKRVELPFLTVVGMEVRLKNDEVTPVNTDLLLAIEKVKKTEMDIREQALKVGVFSETPSTCQGYWTKSAVEKYIDFSLDHRNNFDWILNKGYDYIITDFPNILNQLRTARGSN
jgi:glycerophosphoryl diester phosphodiesterase